MSYRSSVVGAILWSAVFCSCAGSGRVDVCRRFQNRVGAGIRRYGRSSTMAMAACICAVCGCTLRFTGADGPHHAAVVSKTIRPAGLVAEELTLAGEWAFPAQACDGCYVQLLDVDNVNSWGKVPDPTGPVKRSARYTAARVDETSCARIPTSITPFQLELTATPVVRHRGCRDS